MHCYAVLDQGLILLQRHGCVSYRALKRQFDLDDACLRDLKDERLSAHPQAVNDEGWGLVWTEDTSVSTSKKRRLAPNAFLLARGTRYTADITG